MNQPTSLKNRREELHQLLKQYCDHVYYQPPESVKMIYPCIVYGRTSVNSNFADNNPYLLNVGYSMTYITKEPDDTTVMELALLPKCRHTNHRVKDNLHHDSYTIFY